MAADDPLAWWNPDAPAMTPKERKKRLPTAKRGHIAIPGTGPAGETCGSCQHLAANDMRSGRRFYKCGLNRAKWTGGPGSDIRMKDAACAKWEKAD